MKIAVITGASSGLGKEFAKQIAARYSRFDEIWLIARRKECMEEIAAEMKPTARIISVDLSETEELNALRELLNEHQPDIKLLVNCAGFGKTGKVEEIRQEDQTGMIDVNCRALTAVTAMCLPYISNNSRIINVASAAAFVPQPNFAVYAATKSYVLSFSKALRRELKSRKITVTAVCPGPVDTAFFEVAGDEIKFLKKLAMADADKVVEKAIKDAALGNELSIYGKLMNVGYFLTRILPDKLVMKFFM